MLCVVWAEKSKTGLRCEIQPRTAVLDICSRGVQFTQSVLNPNLIFTFGNHLLRILHAVYLVSNKVALNPAKITVFLHLSFNQLPTRHQLSPRFDFSKLCLEDRKKVSKTWQTVLRESNTTRNVRVFTLFSDFMLYRISAKSILPPKIAYFFLLLYLGKY